MRAMGLSTRLALTLVILVAVVQAISLVGYLSFQSRDVGSWRLPVPVRIAAAADALDQTPPNQRDRLLVAMNGDASHFFISSATPPGYRERHGFLPLLYQGYGAALKGRDVRILIADPPREMRPRFPPGPTTAYSFSVALADGQRLVVAPSIQQRRRGVITTVLLLNLVVGFIAALLVWRTVRNATRSLEAIAEASDRFAADLSTPPMQLVGPVEARQVASAFNRMRAQIKALMAERMRMLAAVAHDLRTLLTRLRLRVALIDDDEQRARGDRDVALMAALIEDVLMVARGEEKRPSLTLVDLPALLKDVVQERQDQGQEVSLGLLEPVQLLADSATLRRIVENLVENAVAYAGSAEVCLQCDADAWTLQVTDHGPGLDQAFAPSAFEPFSRGETSRNRDTGGAGLGLSIARTLARQMGGDLILRETPGGGVTAVVLLKASCRQEVG